MGLTRTVDRKTVAQRGHQMSEGARRARRKFLRFFPRGFDDAKYIAWERGYKADAHQKWRAELDEKTFRELLQTRSYSEIAGRAVRIESRTNLLFSFEKMALRDSVKGEAGARLFATGLYELLHGEASQEKRFGDWIETVSRLPRKQTRVLTWPLVTVFGFIGEPAEYIFLKPKVTRLAAEEYGFPFHYESRPNWETYRSLLEFAETIRRDNADLGMRDMIDAQSFMWVQGSEEYEE